MSMSTVDKEVIKGQGESTLAILGYWWPEAISSALLIFFPMILDAYFVAGLKSTVTYGALGLTSKLLHTLIKLSEAICVATVMTVGRHNGAKEYAEGGNALGDSFWGTLLLGFGQFLIVLFGASFLFQWLGAPSEMAAQGIPYLQVQSMAVLLAFLFMALQGFLKGVKNTRVLLYITIAGLCSYVFIDYALIFGKFGFPEMRLMGSAIASLVRYGMVSIIAIAYLLSSSKYRFYFTQSFFSVFRPQKIWSLIKLSIPVMVDKATLAASYVWLLKMIAPIGVYAIAAMDVVQNLERFAFIPAIAFAQVVTFLVSNCVGAADPEGARRNVTKVLMLSALGIALSLGIMCFNAESLVALFDQQGQFTKFAARALLLLSPLVVFDLLQLILAGAIRGAGDVSTVMWTRICCCCGVLLPFSYAVSHLPNTSDFVRFVLTYGSFYLNTALMGFIFLLRLSGNKWLSKKV